MTPELRAAQVHDHCIDCHKAALLAAADDLDIAWDQGDGMHSRDVAKWLRARANGGDPQ